jgi:glycosyltransferase involved in cell wall biosynthesis
LASDLVICEQARRNLELYWLLARKYRKRRPLIALWGHGIDYTVNRTGVELLLQKQLTRRADWFFGYTHASVQHAIDAGVSPDRTTMVMNAIDSAALGAELSAITEQEITDFRVRHGIPARAALFIGGLDPAKRVDLLVAAAVEAHSAEPDFAVIVIGAGSGNNLLSSAISKGAIIHLGPQFGRNKSVALRAATSLAVPGRVGLVAVEALVSGLSIVTATGSLHAPEVDYLTPGVNLFTTEATPEAYARGLLTTLPGPSGIEAPTIEDMAQNFWGGIKHALKL